MAEISTIVTRFESWIEKDKSDNSNISKDILDSILDGRLEDAKKIIRKWKNEVITDDTIFNSQVDFDRKGNLKDYIELLDDVLKL